MTYRVTQKEIKNNYDVIICARYCSLQTLLQYESPIAYAVRKEGWAADIYDMETGLQLQRDMHLLEMFVRHMKYVSVTKNKLKKFAVFRTMKKS